MFSLCTGSRGHAVPPAAKGSRLASAFHGDRPLANQNPASSHAARDPQIYNPPAFHHYGEARGDTRQAALELELDHDSKRGREKRRGSARKTAKE